MSKFSRLVEHEKKTYCCIVKSLEQDIDIGFVNRAVHYSD